MIKEYAMTQVVIDKKKYVILPEEDFLLLQKKLPVNQGLKNFFPSMKRVNILKL